MTVASAERQQELLDAALEYAAQGIKVLPVHSIERGRCTCGKNPCKDKGKHPALGAGFNRATTSSAKIKSWWAKGAWNIGAVPGESGFVVFDIDPWKDGETERLKVLEEEHGEMPATLTILSGEHSGERGKHYWFALPEGKTLSKTKVGGIEFKSSGGYVLMPPSLHASGALYEKAEGDFDTAAPVPPWMMTQVVTKEPGKNGDAPATTAKPLPTWVLKALQDGIPDDLSGPRSPASTQRDWLCAAARALALSHTDLKLAQMLLTSVAEASNIDSSWPWQASGPDGVMHLVASVYQTAARPLTSEDSGIVIKGARSKNGKAPERDDDRVLIRTSLSEEAIPLDFLIEPALPAAMYTTIAGDSGRGRSMLSLSWVAQLAEEGRRCVYLDMENGPNVMMERLEAMGVPKDKREENIFYFYRPAISEDVFGQILEEIFEVEPDLVVVDDKANFFEALNWGEDDSDASTAFLQEFALPLVDAGIAVLDLDALGHERKTSGRGSSQKKYSAQVLWTWMCAPWSSSQSVVGSLKLQKARRGGVPTEVKYRIGGENPRAHLMSLLEAEEAQIEQTGKKKEFLKEVCSILKESESEYLSLRKLVTALRDSGVSGNDDTWRAWLTAESASHEGLHVGKIGNKPGKGFFLRARLRDA